MLPLLHHQKNFIYSFVATPPKKLFLPSSKIYHPIAYYFFFDQFNHFSHVSLHAPLLAPGKSPLAKGFYCRFRFSTFFQKINLFSGSAQLPIKIAKKCRVILSTLSYSEMGFFDLYLIKYFIY